MNVKPDAALVAEVTHATDTPGINVKQHGEVKLGKGPTISIGRENHAVVIDLLRKAAKARKIPLQVETFCTSGGTDALGVFNKLGGVPAAVVGVPNRYMHTTVEIVDLRDLQRGAQLLAEFALRLKKGQEFRVEV